MRFFHKKDNQVRSGLGLRFRVNHNYIGLRVGNTELPKLGCTKMGFSMGQAQYVAKDTRRWPQIVDAG